MYRIKEIKCKDGKTRKAVVNNYGHIVTFDALFVYLVECSVKENVK